MAQFDICPVRSPSGRSSGQLVVRLQHSMADGFATTLVAPLLPVSARASIDRISIPIAFGGKRFWLALDRMAAVDNRQLGEAAGSAASDQDVIKRGIDLLFFGF